MSKRLNQLLDEYNYDFLKDKYMYFQWALENGHLEVVKYLISVGCNPKIDDNMAIRRACLNGHLEVIKYLISVGCDPKADSYMGI